MKSNFTRAICTLTATATLCAFAPLEAFAAAADKQSDAQGFSHEISLQEFAEQTSALALAYEDENAFFGEIEIKPGESGVYINGEKQNADDFEASKTVSGVLMADAGVFEVLDSNADILCEDGEITLSTDNGEIAFADQSSVAVTENGETMLSQKVETLSDTAMLPIVEVAQTLGYEAYETENSVILRNPFESARLIVKSSGEIDILNAVDVVNGFMDLHILQFENSSDAYSAYQIYANSDNVEYVVPSQQVSVQSTAETAEHYSWGADVMSVDGFNTTLEQSGVNDNEVIVAVVDSGIDTDHEMFEGRLADVGVNFSSSNVAGAEDDHGHGTHVSGIICDLTLDNVKILPVKALDSSGKGYDEAIFTAILYAIESGADVINLSLGGFGTGELYQDAVEIANANGVVMCAAAGNDGVDCYRTMPAMVDGIITVSALDSDLNVAYYSNFGDEVEFCAPGTRVLSAYLDGQYAYLTGTSMAAPHVAAAVAMLKCYDNTLDYQQIVDILANNAVDLGKSGYDEYYGFGMVCFDDVEICTQKCDEVEFSVISGEYDEGFELELTNADADAQIYYTVNQNGFDIANAMLYTEPIDISNSCVIYAAAVCEGKYQSNIKNATYIIENQDTDNCFVVENGVLTKYNGVLSDVAVPENVDGQIVTAIGIDAFEGNKTVTSIALPQTVTEIGENAFADCVNLENVDANAVTMLSNGAFYGCASLKSVNFDAAVTVGESCFEGCTVLESVTLPNATEILAYAFFECESLEKISAPNVKSLGEGAFYGCTNLVDAQLDFANMTAMGDGAFYMCNALKTLIVCNNLESIGRYCFFGAKSLECVILPNDITALPDYCFEGCCGLYYFEAAGLIAIGEEALDNCGDVFASIGIETPDINGTTLHKFEIPLTQTQTAACDELCILQNGTDILFENTQSGTYYIKISGAVSAQISIIDANCNESAAQYLGDEGSQAIYSAELDAGTYSITVTSKSADSFAAVVTPNVQNGTDISDCEIICSTELFSDTSEEDIDLTVSLNGTVLENGVDYLVSYIGFGVAIFGMGNYCGYARIYEKTVETAQLYEIYKVNSEYGGKTLAFTPQLSGIYYYYALFDEELFAKFVQSGTGATVVGEITNQSGDTVAFSNSCSQLDCYSYTYFYIEAYLEQGQTYYLHSDTLSEASEYCVRITDTLTQMFDTSITVTSSVASTGEEVFADVTVKYSGKALVNGEDYLVITVDNVLPGYASVYIMGVNNYFGVASRRFTVTADNCEKQSISLSNTYDFDLAQHEFAAVSITIGTEAKYRISFDCDSTVYSYIKHTDTSLSYQYEKNNVEMTMKTGEYVILFYSADLNAAQISVNVERLYSITDATVRASSLEYSAGVVQTPTVTLYYGFTKLTEGVDYTLTFIASSHLPGVYYYKVTGIGDYTGSATGTYTIDCEISSRTATAIGSGEHTVNITTAGSYKVFKFTAEQDATYLLSTSETANVALIVFDESGNMVTSNCAPMGFGTEFTMTAGDVMYIVAMYYNHEKTGSWQFEMTNDYTLLEDVEAVYDAQIYYYGEKTLPDVTFVDGDYTLTEGVDYAYYYAWGCNNYGKATVCYKGLGEYKFYRYVEYELIAPLATLIKNPTQLTQDKSVYYDKDYDECGIYSFKASKDGRYNLSLLSSVESVYVHFYDENGIFIDSLTYGGGSDYDYTVFLKENETVYMAVNYLVCMNYESYSGFCVKASYRNSLSSQTYTQNGVTYTVFTTLGYAVVSDVDETLTNIEIASEIEGVAVTQINADVFRDNKVIKRVVIPDSVTEIGANCFANSSVEKVFVSANAEIIGYRAFAQTDIAKLCVFSNSAQFILDSVLAPSVVYGYANSTAQSWCAENDVEFVLITNTYGDANGDGKINAMDATLVARYAVGATLLDLDLLASCDVTGDGRINALDATYIARYAVGLVDKFPCEE